MNYLKKMTLKLRLKINIKILGHKYNENALWKKVQKKKKKVIILYLFTIIILYIYP